MSDMHTPTVDDLLARYLVLLHEYARLRILLAADQTALYGHLARANFTAERGFRYGPDHFDGRMQATARLVVGEHDGGAALGPDRALPSFVIRRGEEEEEDSDKKQDEKDDDDDVDDKNETDEKDKKDKKTAPNAARDPLRWFGLLTPMALRQAQQAAVHAVDEVVPQLAAVDAEMAAVEIAVRRARKKRARAQKQEQEEQKADRTGEVPHIGLNTDKQDTISVRTAGADTALSL